MLHCRDNKLQKVPDIMVQSSDQPFEKSSLNTFSFRDPSEAFNFGAFLWLKCYCVNLGKSAMLDSLWEPHFCVALQVGIVDDLSLRCTLHKTIFPRFSSAAFLRQPGLLQHALHPRSLPIPWPEIFRADPHRV